MLVQFTSIEVTCGRSVVFSGDSGFLHQFYICKLTATILLRYHIVDSGIKHHNPNPILKFSIMYKCTYI
jgi:hypothetical protein